ncbi:ATP-dependent DNA helicase PIF1, partial [Termitomyces sp. T112]
EAIKYIHKYIYKGHDRTTLEIAEEQRDEIKEHLDARYISAAETCWHIFEFNMHGEHPPVYQLPVHFEGQHEVYFQDNEPSEMFEANAKFPDNNTTYQNFPTKFVYEASKRTWKERQRGTAIGRMYFASPKQEERFYLRMLLTVVTNATSWADLRTVNGHTYPTYKEACKALGLLEDDAEWRQCLAEAAPIQSRSALRQLFCTILFHCAPTTPEALWDEFKHTICDDIQHRLENIRQYRDRVSTDEDVYDYGLYLINDNLENFGKTLQDFPNMPEPQQVWNVIPGKLDIV